MPEKTNSNLWQVVGSLFTELPKWFIMVLILLAGAGFFYIKYYDSQTNRMIATGGYTKPQDMKKRTLSDQFLGYKALMDSMAKYRAIMDSQKHLTGSTQ